MNKLSKELLISQVINRKNEVRKLEKGKTLFEWVNNEYKNLKSKAREKLNQELPFSKVDFLIWVLTQDNLLEVFSVWYISGYHRDYHPLLSRKEKRGFWILDNMEINFRYDILVKSNEDSYVKEKQKSKSKSHEKISVCLMNKDNSVLKIYPSIKKAMRKDEFHDRITSKSQMEKTLKKGGDFHVQGNKFRLLLEKEKGKRRLFKD